MIQNVSFKLQSASFVSVQQKMYKMEWENISSTQFNVK